MLECIDEAGLDFAINGNTDYIAANILNISFANVDTSLLVSTGAQHCSLSAGAACSCRGGEPSHVLTAMGLPDERIRGALRFSWGYEPLNREDIMTFLAIAKNMQSQNS